MFPKDRSYIRLLWQSVGDLTACSVHRPEMALFFCSQFNLLSWILFSSWLSISLLRISPHLQLLLPSGNSVSFLLLCENLQGRKHPKSICQPRPFTGPSRTLLRNSTSSPSMKLKTVHMFIVLENGNDNPKASSTLGSRIFDRFLKFLSNPPILFSTALLLGLIQYDQKRV